MSCYREQGQGQGQGQGQEVPRNECRTVILTALADVIGDVIEKHSRGEEGEENAIRVAVRGWLDGLGGPEAGI